MSNPGRRGNPRGPGRGNGGSQGEEVQLWNQIKDEIKTLIESINASTGNTREILAQDQYMAKNKGTIDEDVKLEDILRKGVRINESTKSQIDALVETLHVLRAVQKNKEEAEANAAPPAPRGPGGGLPRSGSVRGAGARERELQREKERDRSREREEKKDAASLYEFDEPSPVPSPLAQSQSRKDPSVENRDSVPPVALDTPMAKADSLPPEQTIGATQRSKVIFVKGQDVVFKPKNPDNTDWFLGRVVQVLGEGKSRRYKVQDADPDVPPEERTEYRTSASSMIPIPAAGVELPDLEKGKTVLALYPDSTTFYKAEVMGMENGNVSLRFEGEENSGTLQVVDRRFVVEYRN
ncbi:SGF29 tudor-like domain-containing protein [Coniochaeta sp. 2T2.1]|nr:SGF29 tudor-like domain-containing protein [Coniochaeta sp. 2T2.1]